MKKFVSMLLVVVMVSALFVTVALAHKDPVKDGVEEIIDAIEDSKEAENEKAEGIFNGVMKIVKSIVLRFKEGWKLFRPLNAIQALVNRIAF